MLPCWHERSARGTAASFSIAALPASVSATAERAAGRFNGSPPPFASAVPRAPAISRWPSGTPPTPKSVAFESGTSVPLRPFGSVITSCSCAQSPAMFGSPLAVRAARSVAGFASMRWP
jgi:hypothetical protein